MQQARVLALDHVLSAINKRLEKPTPRRINGPCTAERAHEPRSGRLRRGDVRRDAVSFEHTPHAVLGNGQTERRKGPAASKLRGQCRNAMLFCSRIKGTSRATALSCR